MHPQTHEVEQTQNALAAELASTLGISLPLDRAHGEGQGTTGSKVRLVWLHAS